MNIRFRHLRISDGMDTISGIVLCFETIQEAEFYCKLTKEGFRSGKAEVHSIHFYKFESDKKYSVIIKVNGLDEYLTMEIPEIEDMYVKDLKRQLEEYQYIFIIAARSVENEVEIINDHYFCSSRISINNEEFIGQSKRDFPIHILKELVKKI
jgi:hypothetical protein